VKTHSQESGSLIVIIANGCTNASPPTSNDRQTRATLGMVRTGSWGNGFKGYFPAFSIANSNATHGDEKGIPNIQTLSNDHLDPLLASAARSS
ncbi:MAG: hypothetical protein IPL17_11370, partial [Anaerolineales bacterium]|nr:hypothetical protein [Anaerolineales bacterium]